MGFDLLTDVIPDPLEILELAPAGHFLAVRIGFAYPVLHRNSLPDKWVKRYTDHAYMMKDPSVLWALNNTGEMRWSAFRDDDLHGVLVEARRFGLNHGVTISTRDDDTGERSYGSFTRSDRDFTDDEIARLKDILLALHEDYRQPPKKLTNAEKAALTLVRDGYLMKEIANFLGVSEGAVKLRLRKAKTKLNAKTSTQAAARASAFGFI